MDAKDMILTETHPTAVIDPRAELGAGVSVGPYAVIGPNVVIGEGTQIGATRGHRTGHDARPRLRRAYRCGARRRCAGPEVRGEPAQLIVGDRTTVREFVTLNRGTEALGRTEIGSDCLIMAYAHVAHDCMIGDHVVLANSVNMGGHVEIEEWAIVGGLTAIHQFARIGCARIRGRLGRGAEGRAAVREGGEQSASALRPEQPGPAAAWLFGGQDRS
jgi:UDP-N-acetylglucosamine acyltransferase